MFRTHYVISYSSSGHGQWIQFAGSWMQHQHILALRTLSIYIFWHVSVRRKWRFELVTFDLLGVVLTNWATFLGQTLHIQWVSKCLFLTGEAHVHKFMKKKIIFWSIYLKFSVCFYLFMITYFLLVHYVDLFLFFFYYILMIWLLLQ